MSVLLQPRSLRILKDHKIGPLMWFNGIDLIQCQGQSILFSLLCFPSYLCTDFSGTRCAHSAQWNLTVRKRNHKCWYLWSHISSTPAHLNSELSFHLQRTLPLVLQGLHKHTPHPAACFLTILKCSQAEQTERCPKEHFCLECGPQGQVHIHETSKQKINTHKVLRRGEINFLQGTWCCACAFANIKSEGNMHSSVVATLG